MHASQDDSRRALADLCRSAGERALRGQSLSAAAAPAAPQGRRRGRLLPWLAALAGLSAVLLVLLRATGNAGGPPAPVGTEIAPATHPPVAAAPVRSADPAGEAARPPAATAGPQAAAGAHWQGPELVLEFDHVPLRQAMADLAQATGATIHGSSLIDDTAPLTLSWRGTDPMQAWGQLLESRAISSIACSPAGCRIRISGRAYPTDGAPEGDTEVEPEGK